MAPLSYLDAGSGSMLLQIVLGGVAAIGVTAKMTWRRLLRTLRIRRDDELDSSALRSPPPFAIPRRASCTRPTGEVLRELSPRAQEDWDALERTRFFRRALEDGRIVATEEVEPGAAAARAAAVRLIPVRVAVRDAARGGAAAALAARRGTGRGLRAQGRLAVQRPVARLGTGVRGRRLLRAAARGRALGRLPPVLRALPLSADAAGLPRRRATAVAAREPRRDRAEPGASAPARVSGAAC